MKIGVGIFFRNLPHIEGNVKIKCVWSVLSDLYVFCIAPKFLYG